MFRQKVITFVNVLVKGEIFGKTNAFLYSIEWQKRGLPHILLLLWLHSKIRPNDIDKIISAEIPDPHSDPVLHDIVTNRMVHGPCGILNPHSLCMDKRQCSKKYPRQFIKDTQTNENGYPLYRRRSPDDGGLTKEIRLVGGVTCTVDNKWIVPYSPILLRMFNAHINVECCNSVSAIKYICKYVLKGSDRAIFNMQHNDRDNKDEVKLYLAGRYICSSEGIWRILGFDLHNRSPTVVHLANHLENIQRIYFNSNNLQDQIFNPHHTTLTAFFKLCSEDDFAKTLLYNEVPQYYRWMNQAHCWQRRKEGIQVPEWHGIRRTNTIGRVYVVHISNFECFCLRLLLHNIRGPTSFKYLKTIGNNTYDTFAKVCNVLGLLENDQHWINTLDDAKLFLSPRKMRMLFAIMIASCGLSDPKGLWDTFKYSMTEDILYRIQENDREIFMNNAIYNEALIIIQNYVRSMSGNLLSHFGFSEIQVTITNNEVVRELNYNTNDLIEYVNSSLPKLLPEQLHVFNTVIHKVYNNDGGIVFLDAPGGTGKTHVLNLLLSEIRRRGDIALAVATSGIAATLLRGGRTAHSALKLPLNLSNDNSLCHIKKNSDTGVLLQRCKLLVWDESTMAHKNALSAIDSSLRDIRGNDSIMGGLVIVLAGDFRQTLPIVNKGTPADEIYACMKHSPLWKYVDVHRLTINMRARLFNDVDAEKFSKELLKIGNGTYTTDNNGNVCLSNDIGKSVNTVEELIDAVFPDILTNRSNHDWLANRAILAPKNDGADVINALFVDTLPGRPTVYESRNSVVDDDDSVHYPVEFLNDIALSGLPPHKLI